MHREKLEIIIGSLLLLAGWITTLLMVIKVVPPSVPLSLLCYAISIIGLALSTHGIVSLFLPRRKRKADRS